MSALLLAVALLAVVPQDVLQLVTSPQVEGATVTFRLRAPRARDVTVRGDVGSHPMERDEHGVWSVRVPGVKPGTYGYWFVMDGVQFADPANPVTKGIRWVPTSMLYVPGGTALDEPRDVPRGLMHLHEYRSRWGTQVRRLQVYTPPGYERAGRVDVLFLLPGFSDTDATWAAYGRAGVIADNLLAEKRIRPVLLVMPDNHPLDVTPGQKRTDYLVTNAQLFARELEENIVPLVEAQYRVKKGSGQRSVVGTDHGGQQALVAGFGPRSLFARIVALAPLMIEHSLSVRGEGPPPSWLLLELAPGDSERPVAERLVEELRARRAPAQLQTAQRQGNSWLQARRSLVDILPRMFAPAGR